MLLNTQENQNMTFNFKYVGFFTIYNYIDMIIICLLKELIIINLPFFEKQETII